MSQPLTVFSLCIISIGTMNSYPTIHCGDPTIQNDTDTAIDGCAYYSFSVIDNVTDIWFSTCRSEFDTYQYVINASGHVIAQNDDSDACNLQSVLHLSQSILNLTGNYTLKLTGFGNDTGEYKLNMYCNVFDVNLYPGLALCNNVFGQPVDVCLPSKPGSTKYVCDDALSEVGYPLQTTYGSTNCTGDPQHVWDSKRGPLYTCDAARNCDYITVFSREINGDDCFDYNDSHVFKYINIVNLCVPGYSILYPQAGSIKIFCTDEWISIHVYDDGYCMDLAHIENFTLGCNEFEISNISVEIMNISCPATHIDGGKSGFQYDHAVLTGIIIGVGLLILLCILILGYYRCKRNVAINYRSKMKVYKQYLLDDTEMSVNSTYSDEGRAVNTAYF
eukprot:288992_1